MKIYAIPRRFGMPEEKYLECGKIINTHGVKGGLMVESWCDDVETLCKIKTLYYKKREEFIPLEVTKASIHKDRGLMYFRGIDDMDAAALLKNRVVYADRDDIPLDDDRVFIADIIGLPVYNEKNGEKLGILADLIESPASDLFVVKREDGSEVLVPAVDEFIGHIDGEGVFLCPIPGMFDDGGEVIKNEV